MKLMIISRDTLLQVRQTPQSKGIFRALANITRKGILLLLTAPEPDHWLPTRGSVDSALAEQGELQVMFSEAGGDLDGVYYVPRSLLTQNRNRQGALKDILGRYGIKPKEAMLISSSMPFLKAAERLEIPVTTIPDGPSCSETLEKVVKSLPVG